MGGIDQILTHCLLESQGEEMPAYFGNSARDAQTVTWYLFSMSRPELERSVQANKSFISANEKLRYVAQYSILAELRRRWDEGQRGVDEVLERLGHLGEQMELVQTEHLQLGNYRAYSLRLLEGLCRMTDVTT
ncbi:hypothetical protein J7T55_005633 [Diaporthe amygdali]|uniref:uncharacterized protein n=1 Tax=Phomopsis amygdali TaxID=1214568 RepID=UPI0022FE63D4|nr:uncharacterized protein J7T55_005633 [Diaporthe amygdali]KAJ0124295.1 hypothetical protein J7T55_005633 [Diaporthe amygdali]